MYNYRRGKGHGKNALARNRPHFISVYIICHLSKYLRIPCLVTIQT